MYHWFVRDSPTMPFSELDMSHKVLKEMINECDKFTMCLQQAK